MRRPFVVGLLLALCAMAIPAFAGNVYIPVLGAEIDGMITTGYNPTIAAVLKVCRQLVELSIDELVVPGETGMLEVDAADGLVFNARAVGESGDEELVGAQLPVVTADNLVAANRVAHLQGWMRDSDRSTDFGLMSFGQDGRDASARMIAGLPRPIS